MSDDHVRRLERRARGGDAEAAGQLAHARARRGDGGPIDRAHAAWVGGEPARALEELLGLWHARPAPALADAIDALSGHIAGSRDVVPGKTRDIMVKRWREVAADGDTFDVPRLLRALPTLRGEQAASLFETVEGWPPDPRVSRALVELLRAEPAGWTGNKHRPFWERVVRLVRRIGDPAAGPPLRRLVDDHRDFGRGLAAVVAALPAPASILPSEAEALARLLAALAGPTLESPWKAVYADPSDERARRALAAALEAEGDPRGEFMRLQLDRDVDARPGAREKRLLKEHWRAWAGSFLPFITHEAQLDHERGLPAAVRVADVDGAPAPGPEWSTLRRLTFNRHVAVRIPLRLALLDALPRLPRVIDGIPLEALERGVTCEQVSLAIDVGPAELARLARARPSPALRALKLRVHPDGWVPAQWSQADFRAAWGDAFAVFWASPFAAGLEHVWLHDNRHPWRYHEALPDPASVRLRVLRITYDSEGHGAEHLHHREEGAARWYSLLRPRWCLLELLAELSDPAPLNPRISRLRVEVDPDPLKSCWRDGRPVEPAAFVDELQEAARRLHPDATVVVS